MLKRLGCAVLAGIMVMGVTACSKKEASTTSADGVRHIVVGTGNGAAPFCYLDENGNSVGYDIDVLNELDARLPQYNAPSTNSWSMRTPLLLIWISRCQSFHVSSGTGKEANL